MSLCVLTTGRAKNSLFLQASPFAISAEENLAEGLSEVGSEDGVDHRIEKTVQIAEPGEHADHLFVDRQVKDATDRLFDEERQPAENETTHHHAEHFRRLAFAFDVDLLSRLRREDFLITAWLFAFVTSRVSFRRGEPEREDVDEANGLGMVFTGRRRRANGNERGEWFFCKTSGDFFIGFNSYSF